MTIRTGANPFDMNWQRFFSELRRRKVLRATIAYLAVAWLLIQVGSILFPTFEFPEYAIKVLIYVLSFGLVVWIGFSWIYDWTGQGWQKTKDLAEGDDVKVPSLRSVTILASFMAVIFLGGWYFWQRVDKGPKQEVISLAVLPFDDLSGGDDQKAFIAGLQDNLITSLSKLKTLRVISRTSTLRYANTKKSMEEIAGELKVDALIETSVLKVNDSVRINIQLIQVFPEERHLWAQIFDRSIDNNLLAMFNELTQVVAKEIHLKLSPEEKKLLTESKIVDPEALKAYLKGKYWLEKLSPEGFQMASRLFHSAIEIDPGFAPVYAELANTYMYMLQMRMTGYDEALPKIYEYNNKALDLDPDLQEANYTQALIKWFEWDWVSCEQKYKEFLTINPNHVLANAFYAHLLILLKRKQEALPFAEKAVSLDPMNDLVLSLQAVVFIANGRIEEAGVLVQEAFKLNPRSILTLRGMEGISYAAGNLEDSILYLDAIYCDVYNQQLHLQDTFEKEGYRASLEYLCQEIVKNMQDQDVYLALYQDRLGNYQETVTWLVRGYENHDVDIPYLFASFQLQKVFNDPRIIEISDNVGLPRY